MPRPHLAEINSGTAVNWLFMDLNAYFASVEQQERPELRGRPVAVVQVLTPNTVCIAASYQAKPFGVKTGVKVHEARRLCPQLELVLARPKVYVDYHHRILEAVDSCVPVTHVQSIDEAACRLTGLERWLPNALAIARAVKQAVRKVGDTLCCSVGLAPSRYLAKVASDMHKPDGLTTLLAEDLPQALYGLELRDLPGIGARTEARLHAQGVQSVGQLCAFEREGLRQLWGGVWGERMWHWLRGADFDMPEAAQKTLGRQHVLAPEHRSQEAAFPVVRKLLDSAAADLRRQQLWAGGLGVAVKFLGGHKPWKASQRLDACRDSFTLQALLERLWRNCPEQKPLLIQIWLFDLVPEAGQPASLFDEAAPQSRASDAMDALNRRYGAHTVYPASQHGVRGTARTGIAAAVLREMFPDQAALFAWRIRPG